MKKKLKVFECFSGIGAQHKALTNIFNNKEIIKTNKLENKTFEVVGTSEWYIDGVIAYDAIHYGLQSNFKDYNQLKKEDILLFLENFTLSKDSKNPYDFNKIKKLSFEKLRQLYIAIKRTKNFGSILNIKAQNLPKIDLFFYSFPCFVKGTLVLTHKGYKKIEDIKKDDFVLTHNNRYRKVLKPMVNNSNKLYKVSTMASHDLYVTEEHPFYVRKKKYIYDSETKKRNRTFLKPEWKPIKDLSKEYYMGLAINQESKLPYWEGVSDNRYKDKTFRKNKLSKLFENSDFWWLVGLYIGDGWTLINDNNHRVLICTSNKNRQHLKIEEKLKLLNIKYNKTLERTTIRFHLVQKELTQFLTQFGKYAHGKYLNDTIFDLPVNHLKKFIQGYIFSDGCRHKTNSTQFTISSVSKKLIYGIGQCILKAYNVPYSIYKVKKSSTTIIEGRTVNQRNYYIIRFKLKQKIQDKAFFENNYVWFPINKIEKEQYSGKVYNMEVEEDNSYTVNNIIVHNCQDISMIGKGKGIKKGINTRSGLLWEVERILFELKDLKKLPKFLVMENVKALLFKEHYENWLEFEKVLNNLGYKNTTYILNGIDFGIPQKRERIFVISELNGKTNINIEKSYHKDVNLTTFFNWKIDPFKHKNINEYLKVIPNDTPSRQKGWKESLQIYFKNKYCLTITTKQDRNPNAGNIYFPNKELDKNGKLKSQFRYFTPRETLMLMGFNYDDYDKLKNIEISDTEIYKQAGNSIIVNILEGIFISILKKF